MRTSIESLKDKYLDFLNSLELDYDGNLQIRYEITINTEKEEYGNASMTIQAFAYEHDDAAEKDLPKGIEQITLYISEKERATITMLVNDSTHAILYSNTRMESAEMVEKYLQSALKKIGYMALGVERKFPEKRPYNKNEKYNKDGKNGKYNGGKKPYKKRYE